MWCPSRPRFRSWLRALAGRQASAQDAGSVVGVFLAPRQISGEFWALVEPLISWVRADPQDNEYCALAGIC